MIRYLETLPAEQLSEIAGFCRGSAFGLKAIGPVLSYGVGYDFVSAWEQRDDTGRLSAFVSKYYGSAAVCATDACDRDELSAFLRAVGFSSLIGPADLLSEFRAEGETGLVMTLPKGVPFSGMIAEEADLFWDTDIPAFYDVLSRSNPGYLTGDYDTFYTDLSHRIRHDTAHIVRLKHDGVSMAAAAALIVTDTDVFLGAIATVPEARGRHYAATLLSALRQRYPEQTLHLFCRPDKQAFYEHLGMTLTDSFLECAPGWK